MENLYINVAVNLLIGWILNILSLVCLYAIIEVHPKDILKSEKHIYLALILSASSYTLNFIGAKFITRLFISIIVTIIYIYTLAYIEYSKDHTE